MLRKWFGKKEEPAEAAPAGEGADAAPADEAGDAPADEAGDATARDEAGDTALAKVETTAAPVKRSRWSLFTGALSKTRKGLKSLFGLRRPLDDALVDEIEAELYSADFGPAIVDRLMNGPEGVRAAWKERRIAEAGEVREFLKVRLKEMLKKRETSLASPPAPGGPHDPAPPCVVLVAGVNGTGKTTSIAKLAKRLRDGGATVLLAAADTFRAAAVEQLTVWSQRLGVEIVKGSPGADPASIAYRGAETALEKKADYLIVDTAGRLHTQKNLMRELGKVRSVLGKKIPGSPHECLLVLDATTGQNALTQARVFQEELHVTGIILAKLDGTAKGGIVVTISNLLDIPVKFIGTGETLDDLAPFDPDRFVDALLEPPEA
jgi:fused signal recognition particle receptor